MSLLGLDAVFTFQTQPNEQAFAEYGCIRVSPVRPPSLNSEASTTEKPSRLSTSLKRSGFLITKKVKQRLIIGSKNLFPCPL